MLEKNIFELNDWPC